MAAGLHAMARRAPRALAGPRAGLALLAGGVALVAAALVVLVLALFGGGERPVAATEQAPLSALPHQIRSERLGVALQLPATWRRQPGKDVLRFASRDGTMALAVATGPPTLSRVDVRRDAVAQLKAGYEGVRVLDRDERRVGRNLEALTAEVVGRKDDGTSVRALVASVRSSWRTYGITVFSSATPPRERAVETALMLRSLQLTRPRS